MSARYAELFDSFADGEATAGEHAELCRLLHESPACVQEFVRDCHMHWLTQGFLKEDGLREQALGTNEAQVGLAAGLAIVDAFKGEQALRTLARARRMKLQLGVAASLLAILGYGLAWLRVPPPKIVAQVTSVAPNLASGSNGPAPQAGDLLAAGVLQRLSRGRLLSTLTSGAQVVIEGPAEFCVTDSNRLNLVRGRATIIVPRQASGFVVDTPVGRITDLGTEFTLAVSDAVCDIIVFHGLVELTPRSNAPESGPLRVPRGEAVHYDGHTGKATPLEYNPELRMTL